MNIKKLVKELCRREGKKKQVDVAQMTEVVGHLSDILFSEVSLTVGIAISFEDKTTLYELLKLGCKREKKKGGKNHGKKDKEEKG